MKKKQKLSIWKRLQRIHWYLCRWYRRHKDMNWWIIMITFLFAPWIITLWYFDHHGMYDYYVFGIFLCPLVYTPIAMIIDLFLTIYDPYDWKLSERLFPEKYGWNRRDEDDGWDP